ncbi:MAG: heme exporter protein CcmB [Chloroflexi bacterium]|nr:heme exporter protein CcmB [Chloroflexota bacterium]MCC6895791.1 heme exporter protein CcmB [Anaerolineae bacterium]
MKTPFLGTVWAIVRKDLRAELRSRELVSSMALFALLSILVFSFALELDREARESAISGVLWVTVIYASTIGLNRSMAMEREQANLDGMLIAPIDRTAIFFGKLVGNFVFALIVGCILLPVMTILYNKSLLSLEVFSILLLGTLGFATVGTLLATMTVQTRARESLLPIAMLPVTLPMLLSAVRATTGILGANVVDDGVTWPQILIVLDVVYMAASFLLFEYVTEE